MAESLSFRRLSLALVIWLTISVSLRAEIVIPLAARAKNQPPGYCFWCSLQTAARFQKIGNLESVVQEVEKAAPLHEWDGQAWRSVPKGPALPIHVKWELELRKLKFQFQDRGSKNVGILRKATANNQPVIIDVVGYPVSGLYHALLLIRVDDRNVVFVDSNDVNNDYTATLEWLDQHWTGSYIILEKK